MSTFDLPVSFEEALERMECGPGAPCWQAQADGAPCPDLSVTCTECERGRVAILEWIYGTYLRGEERAGA